MGPFDFAPYVGPAISILGGLFGGGQKTNPQATADMNTSRGYLQDQAGVAGKYAALADYAGNNYSQDDPAMRTAANNEISYLQQDPNTNQADAQYLSNAGAGRQAAYQGADANLTANLAARGFTGASSGLAGGEASIQQAQAAANANAASSLAQHQIGQADQNRRGILTLNQQLAGNDYAHETGALGAENSTYGNLGSAYRTLGQYETGQQQQQNQQQAALYGGIGQTIGGALDNSGNDLQDAQTALINAQTEAIKNGTSTPGVVPLSNYPGGPFSAPPVTFNRQPRRTATF
jgi:hypothetical protein